MKFRFLLNMALLPVAACLLSSCGLATFDRYPGEALDAIPPGMHGVYYTVENKDKKAPDSLLLVVREKKWELGKPEAMKTYTLSNTNVFSRYKEHYFVNVKADNSKYWQVFYIGKTADGLKVCPVVSQKNGKAVIDKYMQQINDPSDTLEKHYRMDEEKLLLFFKKEIRKKEMSNFKRIGP